MYTKIKLFALLLVGALLAPVCASAQTPAHFASVYKITGSVVATDAASGSQRTLKAGDPVFVGEQVQSGATGEAVLRTDDAGVIAVRPNAAFMMEQFSANGDRQDKFTVRIMKGALRMITGWTGLFNKDNHRIVTPSATLGIRGTDHEPYVMSADMAAELHQPEGTYNRVYQGGTVLKANGGEVDIEPGRVGFAPATAAASDANQPRHTRALITVLLPSLLDKVPGFFVPGAFDDELEALAQRSMEEAALVHKFPSAPSAESVATPAAPDATVQATAPAVPANATCQPTAIATQWLAELDAAIVRRNALQFVSKFDPHARITATVRNAQGVPTDVSFTREEMVKSTFAAMSELSEYSSRRPTITGTLSGTRHAAKCDHLDVESVVIENGKRNGGSYRVESLEKYKLVRQATGWVAVQASTSQR